MNQRTLSKEVAIEGKSLHTGEPVTLKIKPAAEDHGIVFRRTDLYGKPEIRPQVEYVSDLVRSTSITNEHTTIQTIEHVLSALSGCGVHNALIEMNASEPPILDGSARDFVTRIHEAQIVEQTKPCKVLEIKEPISVTDGNRSLIALPYDGFRITCTSADDRGVHTQHLSLEITPETYIAEIAPARTFTIYEDIEPLLKMGKIQGGSLDSAIVIKGDKILAKEPLRYKDEFVRHKILDIVGDLSLLGHPIKGHIIAVRPGHALNAKLAQAIQEKLSQPPTESEESSLKQEPQSTQMDISQILNLLPHRYPFVMIDRVIEVNEEKQELVAIKNVSINEPYFQGHFPGKPVMPGVLQVEAMAQAAGLLMLRQVSFENKLSFFMSCDKVKFRKVVQPGDQLKIEVALKQLRSGKIATATGKCKVGNQTVSSAEMMFTLIDPTQVA